MFWVTLDLQIRYVDVHVHIHVLPRHVPYCSTVDVTRARRHVVTAHAYMYTPPCTLAAGGPGAHHVTRPGNQNFKDDGLGAVLHVA